MSPRRIVRNLFSSAFVCRLAFTFLAASCAMFGVSFATAAEIDDEQARELVRQLGSAKYSEREEASKQLAKLGLSARAALEAGVDDVDLEIRSRAARLLKDVILVDRKNRIAAFLADELGKNGASLPGWKKFSEHFRVDPAMRKKFAELYEADADLWELVDKEKYKEIGEWFVQKAAENPQQVRVFNGAAVQPNPAKSMLLLYAAGLPEVTADEGLVDRLVQHVQMSGFVNSLLNNTGDTKFSKALFARWATKPGPLDVRYKKLQIAFMAETPGLLDLGVDILKAPEGVTGAMRRDALILVGRFGTAEHLPLVEPCLKDDEVVHRLHMGNNKVREVQVKDVALSASLNLLKIKPSDYGFPTLQAIRPPNLHYEYQALVFPDDAKRTAAWKKWNEREKKS